MLKFKIKIISGVVCDYEVDADSKQMHVSDKGTAIKLFRNNKLINRIVVSHEHSYIITADVPISETGYL